MDITSAGILLYRKSMKGEWEFFLTHFGGPLWKTRKHSWSIPKGQVEEGETVKEAAHREFLEETGIDPNRYLLETPLTTHIKGKDIIIFPAEADGDEEFISSNTFILNGMEYPENDKGDWIPISSCHGMCVNSAMDIINKFLKSRE